MGGVGGNLGGTLVAVGKGAPVVSPHSGDESANGRPLGGGWPGGYWLVGPRIVVRFLTDRCGGDPSGGGGRAGGSGRIRPARPGWVVFGLLACLAWGLTTGHNWAVHSMTSRRAG